jgi:hypothetical protein
MVVDLVEVADVDVVIVVLVVIFDVEMVLVVVGMVVTSGHPAGDLYCVSNLVGLTKSTFELQPCAFTPLINRHPGKASTGFPSPISSSGISSAY